MKQAIAFGVGDLVHSSRNLPGYPTGYYTIRGFADAGAEVLLERIYGTVENEDERGFPSKDFSLAVPHKDRCKFKTGQFGPVISMGVRLPVRIADALAAVNLFPLVENQFRIYQNGEDCREDLIAARCDDWEVVQEGFSHGEMNRRICEEMEAGAAMAELRVHLTGDGAFDLLEICEILRIEDEDWLRGVIGNMAARIDPRKAAEVMAPI